MSELTDDDINPRCCRRCRVRKLGSQLSTEGYCAPCVDALAEEARQREEQARLQEEQRQAAADERAARAEAQRLAQYNINTKKGKCASCGSTNVVQFSTSSGGSGPATDFLAFGLVGLLGQAVRPGVSHHRRCRMCGHQWPV